MLLYKFDEITKEYIGNFPAYMDPLESKIQGREVIVIPPNSTLTEPKTAGENEVSIYDEKSDSWKIEKDFRGTCGYNKKTGEQVIITEIGELPDYFVTEKPVFLADLKVEKFRELDMMYFEEQSKEVEVEGITAKAEDLVVFRRTLDSLGELKYSTYVTKDNKVISLTKESLEKIVKALYLRNILLPIVKAERAKEIRACRSKKALDEINLDFDLEKRTNELIGLSTEEINKFIEEKVR